MLKLKKQLEDGDPCTGPSAASQSAADAERFGRPGDGPGAVLVASHAAFVGGTGGRPWENHGKMMDFPSGNLT
jgi:hypothetical protein